MIFPSRGTGLNQRHQHKTRGRVKAAKVRRAAKRDVVADAISHRAAVPAQTAAEVVGEAKTPKNDNSHKRQTRVL